MSHAELDERAIDALREFSEEGALAVLQQFRESDLSHVQVMMQVNSGGQSIRTEGRSVRLSPIPFCRQADGTSDRISTDGSDFHPSPELSLTLSAVYGNAS